MALRHSILLGIVLSLLSGCDERSQIVVGKSGTRVEISRYLDGAVRVEEQFVDGVPTVTRWYRPDGTLFDVSGWTNNRASYYVLRDDGTPLMKGTAIWRGEQLILDGAVQFFDEQGNFVREAQFVNGKEVKASGETGETRAEPPEGGAGQDEAGGEQ